jgi:hypothetical protein
MGVSQLEKPLVFQEAPRAIEVDHNLRQVVLPEVQVSPSGHEVVLSWAGASGATEIEIDDVTVEIGPIQRVVNGTLVAAKKNSVYELSVPAHTRVRSIGLDTLRWVHVVDGESAKTQLRTQSDLGSSVRITIAALDPTNQMVTRYAVPWVGPRGGVPGQFGGASLSNGVITFPEMRDRKIQVGLVDQSSPEDWQAQTVELGSSVSASIVTVAADVSLTGPDGAELWAFPGDLDGVPNAKVSIAPQVQAAFAAALDAEAPIEARLKLVAANDAPIGFRVTGPRGSLVRRFASVEAIDLEGDPVVPALLAAGDAPLDAAAAGSVRADTTITYAGIRLLDTIADELPAPSDVHGFVVRSEPRVRTLPPDSLREVDVARIGLIGRAPEACELSVQLVDTRRNGTPVGPPGVVQLDPHDDIRTVWVEMPALEVGDASVAISAKATRGRFFWCADDAPLVRVAIHDPDPGGRPIRLGTTTIHAMTEETAQVRELTLPAAAFRSTPTAFESDLFVTIEMADLMLRYAR